jgi:uncharacterized protein YabN with tetrapyrrole methylase and pyrophosphatase domain
VKFYLQKGNKVGQTDLGDLLELARRLRDPERGCPWDREQTLETSVKYILEEAGELKGAVEKKDVANMAEEMGDLLFCLALFTAIVEETGSFKIDEVVKRVKEKIIRRHTWVFGDDKALTAEEALELWRKNKLKERG